MALQNRGIEENDRLRDGQGDSAQREPAPREDSGSDDTRSFRSARGDLPADPLARGHGRESSFREDFARDGDYLGRHPGDVSGRGRFDEEYFVDEGLSLGPDLSSGDRKEGRPSRELARYRGFGPKNYVRSDERIREDVCDRLTDDPLVDASEIEVFVQSSEVTLAGRVETKAQRMVSEQCAGAVSGVAQVRNHLRIGK